MPGFLINGKGYNGSKPPTPAMSTNEYYHTYTWTIFEIFESTQLSYSAFTQTSPTINLKECTLPTFAVIKETIQGGSLEYKFAKSVSYDDIKITWYDTYGLLPYMIAWRSLVWTPANGIDVANNYKKKSRIVNYLPTGGGVNYWNLINSWPSTIRYGELTYTNSDIKVVDVTVTYDWAEEKFVDNASSLGGIDLGPDPQSPSTPITQPRLQTPSSDTPAHSI